MSQMLLLCPQTHLLLGRLFKHARLFGIDHTCACWASSDRIRLCWVSRHFGRDIQSGCQNSSAHLSACDVPERFPDQEVWRCSCNCSTAMLLFGVVVALRCRSSKLR